MKPILLAVFLTCSVVLSFAQQREVARCGNEFVDYSNLPMNDLLTNNRVSSTNNTIYRIPVVFHVLTDQPNGESNISECIIQNQITILNNCFRRKSGSPNTSQLGADAQIEFYLARKNPSGGATNGINRVTTNNCNYTTLNSATQLNLFRSAAKWPVNQYMNVWVLKTTPTSGGIANGVRGQAFVGGSSSFGSQDIGIFIQYSYVGSKNSGCPNIGYIDATNFDAYDLGMTLVHEVGHYLNLLHTYGSTCSSSDGCDDTPSITGLPNPFCGTNNDSKGVCVTGEKRMWQNYLDYTDDACMDRFTSCQVTRMRNQLANIAFYKNLWTSANITATGGDIATSVNEMILTAGENFKVYPNPFVNQITLISKQSGSIKETYRIVNSFGQEIKRGILNSNTTNINMEGIPAGVYLLEHKKQSYKIIKQ